MGHYDKERQADEDKQRQWEAKHVKATSKNDSQAGSVTNAKTDNQKGQDLADRLK